MNSEQFELSELVNSLIKIVKKKAKKKVQKGFFEDNFNGEFCIRKFI